MDALSLLVVYLVTKNPEFRDKLTPLCDQLKQSEEMLKFLSSLSAFPCSSADHFSEKQQGKHPGKPCDPPFSPTESASSAESPSHASEACAAQKETSPLRALGGEWLEKYVTKYLKT